MTRAATARHRLPVPEGHGGPGVDRGAPGTRAGRADATAFAPLYEAHRPSLFRFCLARTGDPELAEDVVQETFVKAFALFDRFDPSRPFWPWLAAIAARECIDAHRREAAAAARLERVGLDGALPPADPTAGTVLDRLDHSGLARHVARLPARQAAALQLFAVDGWTCAEIAAYLGESTGAVKMLLLRARSRLRRVVERPVLGAVGGFAGLRRRLEAVATRAHAVASLCTESVAGWAASATASGPAAVAVLVALAAFFPVEGDSAGGAAPRAVVPWTAPVSTAPGAVSGPVVEEAAVAPEAAPTWREPPLRAPRRQAEQSADGVIEALAPPEPEATPDNTWATGTAVSPSYEEDRTVFVASSPYSPSLGLFVTRDGGASWSRLRALGFAGALRLLLPPAFPRDPRIFAVGGRGLQVSLDGGETFDTLLAGAWAPRFGGWTTFVDADLSPAFDRGQPTIVLVGAGSVFEYDVETGELRSFLIDGGAPAWVDRARYATGDDGATEVLLATLAGNDGGVTRCRRGRSTLGPEGAGDLLGVGSLRCARLEGSYTPGSVRLLTTTSPGGPVAVLGGWDLRLSLDGGRTFTVRNPWDPFVPHPHISDVVFASPGGTTVLAAVMGSGTRHLAFVRSDDAGATWHPVFARVPGFEAGAMRVTVTPSGRLIATGNPRGIACSADGGRTWARTCPTPDA